MLNEYLRVFIKKLEVGLERHGYITTSRAGARETAAAQKEVDRLRDLRDCERDANALASKRTSLGLDDRVPPIYQKIGSVLRDIGL